MTVVFFPHRRRRAIPWAASFASFALAAGLLVMFPGCTADTWSDPSEESVEEPLLEAAGGRDLRIQDPSALVKEGNYYWIFGTGEGVESFSSKDLVHWERGPAIFPETSDSLHAPDIIKLNGRWHVYHRVDGAGDGSSAIALTASRTLDQLSPDIDWSDPRIVLESEAEDAYNATDPAVIRDEQGRLWMSFGSAGSGVKLIELNPRNGLPLDDAQVIDLAARQPDEGGEISAPEIYFNDGYYYLFVNWGHGAESDSSVRVGRSEEVTGPYVDKEGTSLVEGGGSLFLASEGQFTGPGHVGIFQEHGRFWLSHHFYDAARDGEPYLMIRELHWDNDGWPHVAGSGSDSGSL